MTLDRDLTTQTTFLGWSVASVAVTLGLIGLVIMSLMIQWSLNHAEMLHRFVPDRLFRNQLIFVMVSLIVMLAIRWTNYMRIGEWAYPLFILTVILLAAVLIFGYLGRYIAFFSQISPNINGSFRWIRLPIPGLRPQIQPSEFIKIAYILGLARYLRYRKNYREFKGLLGPFALTLLPMVLILVEPDLGTVMLLFPVLFIMLYAAGAKTRHLAAIILLMICSVPVLFTRMEPYQRSRIVGVLLQSESSRLWLAQHPRIKSYLYPDRSLDQWERSTEGYHLSHSKTAIRQGGIMGCGLGKGPYVEGGRKLPECHNDFVFSMIAHQFGMVGAVCVILLYLVIAVGLTEIAGCVSEPFGRLVAVGVLAMLLIQAGTNMGMTLGLMPITGVTLPFVSYGGSSMLTYFILIGLALSVDRARPVHIGPRAFEFPDDDY